MSNRFLKKLLVVSRAGKSRKYLHFVLLFLITQVFISTKVLAQSEPVQSISNGLTIGNKIPNELRNLPLQVINHPQGKKTITIAEYKDKLIILDFWATWCGSCIKELPRINQLQKSFQKDVKFIIIGSESKVKIEATLKKFKIDTPDLLFINSDTSLKQAFPHVFVPHQVWISNETVTAFSGSSELNTQNITQLLNTGLATFPMKKDLLEFDKAKSLTENILNLELTPLFKYQSILSKRIDGAGRNGQVTKEDGQHRLSFINYPVNELYRSALGISLSEKSNIKWQLTEKSNIKWQLTEKGMPFSNPMTDTYCYEIKSLSENTVEGLKEIMLNDLNRHFKLRVLKTQDNSSNKYIITNQD